MSLTREEWRRLHESRKVLGNPYAYLDDRGGLSAEYPKLSFVAIQEARRLLDNPYAYLNGDGRYDLPAPCRDFKPGSALKRKVADPTDRVEHLVRDLHARLWKRRKELWPEGVPGDPVLLLDPGVALTCEGFDLELAESLGEDRQRRTAHEVAGIVDRKTRTVSISRRLPHETLRFTMAHELGHVLMHAQAVMHRDRPINGLSRDRASRPPMEYEADRFASLFLMPEKLVRARFQEIFGVVGPFCISEDSVFAFSPELRSAVERCRSVRDLSRILASVSWYNGKAIRSLIEQFGVSCETMAIRIEEIGLIDW